MFAYLVRRVLATIPVMAVVALFVFSLLYLAPGDPAAVIAGDQATPDDVERIRASLGLDRPYLVRFSEWVFRILQGDLGTSIFTNLPVGHMIQQRIEPTLSLMIVTLILAISIAIPMGVVAAWKQGTWIDRAVMGFAVLSFSVPVFVVGYLLAYVFALELDWLPVSGYGDTLPDKLLHMLLPGASIVAVVACVRVARNRVRRHDCHVTNTTVNQVRAGGHGDRDIDVCAIRQRANIKGIDVTSRGIRCAGRDQR